MSDARSRLSHTVLDLAEGALELLCPTRCVSCNLPGELLCERCRGQLAWISQQWACPCCGAPYGWLTCTGCDGSWEPASTICALEFEGSAAQLATVFKDQHELRLAPVMAAAIATALDEASGCPGTTDAPRVDLGTIDVLCFVPATAQAYARRGFDHMELVAAALGRQTGLPVIDVLARGSALDQRRLSRQERASNLAGTAEVLEDVSGLSVLLVDDVITTGSTMREVSRSLLAHGAAEVHACALARVW